MVYVAFATATGQINGCVIAHLRSATYNTGALMTNGIRPRRWPYRADIPQRYNDNAHLYAARGGLVRLEDDIRGYAADGESGDISRFYTFCLIQDQLLKEGLVGDVAELGVYKGNTASLLAITARRLGSTAWLFDTFEGFKANDLTGIDADKKLEQFTDTSLEAVRSRVGDENVRYIQGYFPDSLSAVPADIKFTLVHIDCDLYEPITAGLEYFYPRMVPGGFIVMHDYTSLAWNGAERAIDNFFADKVESPIPMPDGAGSAIIRRARDPARDVHWTRPSPLPNGDWISAASGGLRRYLAGGWSPAEEWGVWGMGPEHKLVLAPTTSHTKIEIDCSACLPGVLSSQEVSVFIGELLLVKWEFLKTQNRAIRTVDLPPSAHEIILRFRPKEAVRPRDFDESSNDVRPLGIAIMRLRQVS